MDFPSQKASNVVSISLSWSDHALEWYLSPTYWYNLITRLRRLRNKQALVVALVASLKHLDLAGIVLGMGSNVSHWLSPYPELFLPRTDLAHEYRQTSNIRHTSPVGAAQTTSSFSTEHMTSIDWAKTIARRDEKHLGLGAPYITGLTLIDWVFILAPVNCWIYWGLV